MKRQMKIIKKQKVAETFFCLLITLITITANAQTYKEITTDNSIYTNNEYGFTILKKNSTFLREGDYKIAVKKPEDLVIKFHISKNGKINGPAIFEGKGFYGNVFFKDNTIDGLTKAYTNDSILVGESFIHNVLVWSRTYESGIKKSETKYGIKPPPNTPIQDTIYYSNTGEKIELNFNKKGNVYQKRNIDKEESWFYLDNGKVYQHQYRDETQQADIVQKYDEKGRLYEEKQTFTNAGFNEVREIVKSFTWKGKLCKEAVSKGNEKTEQTFDDDGKVTSTTSTESIDPNTIVAPFPSGN